MNLELPKQGLVTWTSGNVSGRDPETGVRRDQAQRGALRGLDAREHGGRRPRGNRCRGSAEAVGGHRDAPVCLPPPPDVGGVVHTHSTYATSFALLGQAIPVYLTAMADEFGTEIPIGAYCQIGDEQIGQEIVRSIGDSPAILIKSHGVFTIGKNAEAAVKAAVMTEDVAKTVHIALLRGQAEPLPADEVARLHRVYLEQLRPAARPLTHWRRTWT